MRPREQKDALQDTAEAVNHEQMDEDQAQDIAAERLYGQPGDDHDVLDSTKGPGGLYGTEEANDVIDTVDQLKQMVRSGRIDMGAYDGEPMMDDGDTVLNDSDDPDGREGYGGDDNIGGADSDLVSLEDIADEGDDPLARLASDHGDDGETMDDDADPADIDDEDDLPEGLRFSEEGMDELANVDDGDDDA